MPARTTSFPVPESLRDLTPDALAAAAVAGIRQVYGVELDYSPASLARLDAVVAEHLRPGHYTRESFPSSLAITLGAYVGVTLLRHVSDGRWGWPEDNLYGSPLHFLTFKRGEYERQINVVEEIMHFLWSGDGLSPLPFYEHHTTELARIGFTVQ